MPEASWIIVWFW